MKSNIKFPKIMGIINATPDSFSDGGKYFSENSGIDHALQLIDEGADYLDIGGESTRPGAQAVSVEEEINRVIPIIQGIRKFNNNIPISVDTTKYEVAKLALDAGANLINDISGLTFEPRLASLSAEYNAQIILMHIKGEPRTMQTNPEYQDVVKEVCEFLEEKRDLAYQMGAKDVIIDIGIGFGKTVEHNFDLLKNLEYFEKLNCPILLGISRKSFIGKSLNIENPSDRDAHTAIIHTLLLNKNVDIIRVHNVKLLSDTRKLAERLIV